MIVAAMLDAGLDRDVLAAGIDSLGIDGLQIKADYTKRCGIKAGLRKFGGKVKISFRVCNKCTPYRLQ